MYDPFQVKVMHHKPVMSNQMKWQINNNEIWYKKAGLDKLHMSVRCNCLSQWVYWTNLLEIEFIFSTHQETATK